ncbi:class II aldolase/adducin family protein [Streptomyces botrytidirepellens]|uniref:class II aldolase/adducin family protein n=1 Tax=Streptomyces botrytidirepellens TaxID=2486417 RepID=UPI001FEAD561|nr:class II aldolase/adducin family protein [Streptomyces botrytidirepellens]
MSGAVQPGDRIPSECRLTEMLGVNRPTVREALKSLGLLGLLEIRQSNGTCFRGPDSDVLYRLFELGLVLGERGAKDMLQARAELEVVVVGLAAEARDEAGVELLRARLAAMRECPDAEFAEADTAFHATLAELADNSVLRDGHHIDGPRPTKEAFLHAAFYRARPGAHAVVHLHSTHAVAVSCLAGTNPGNALPPLTAYDAMRIGTLPLLPFHAPGDRGLEPLAEETARTHHAILLANHGPVAADTPPPLPQRLRHRAHADPVDLRLGGRHPHPRRHGRHRTRRRRAPRPR